MWGKILLIIVGIATMFILLALSQKFLKIEPLPEKLEVSGDKSYVIDILVRNIYNCFEVYGGKKGSVICIYLKIESSEDIYSNDVMNRLDPMKIDKSKVKVDDLGSSGEVVIRYENQNIYVEKIEYERISS